MLNLEKENHSDHNNHKTGGVVLPPDHYIVPCGYCQFPSMGELNKTFPGGISNNFHDWRWNRYSLCINAREVPGNLVMFRKRFGRRMESEQVIAWGLAQRTAVAPNGYRPAMGHHEVIDFHRVNPELCQKGWYVGLGSFVIDVEFRRRVAVLFALNGAILDSRLFDSIWCPHNWFIFVSN